MVRGRGSQKLNTAEAGDRKFGLVPKLERLGLFETGPGRGLLRLEDHLRENRWARWPALAGRAQGADMSRYVIDAPTLLHLLADVVKVSPRHQIVAQT